MKKKNVEEKLAVFVEMCDFPASKQELLQMAEEQEFPDEVMNVFEDVADKEYTCESDLIEATENITDPVSSEI